MSEPLNIMANPDWALFVSLDCVHRRPALRSWLALTLGDGFYRYLLVLHFGPGRAPY